MHKNISYIISNPRYPYDFKSSVLEAKLVVQKMDTLVFLWLHTGKLYFPLKKGRINTDIRTDISGS